MSRTLQEARSFYHWHASDSYGGSLHHREQAVLIHSHLSSEGPVRHRRGPQIEARKWRIGGVHTGTVR